ncbi:MAG: PDZ domain-containing protein [Ruminococcaceae bacterium]|nr:PDZ domain-containing protein [Oscillospiraceae bacterium]
MKKKITFGSALALMFIAVFVTFQITYFVVGNIYKDKLIEISNLGNEYNKYSELDSILESNAILGAKTDDALDSLLSGYVNGFSDVYTSYLSKDEYSCFEKTRSGSDTPFGFDLFCNEEDGIVYVQYVHPGSPAEEAGIKVGDIPHSVNGTYMCGKRLLNIISEYNKDFEGKTKLDFVRNEKIVSFTLEEKNFEIINFDYKILYSGALYIYMGAFDSSTVSEACSVIEQNKDAVSGIIIDIRNSKTGSVTYANQILDILLQKTDTIKYLDKAGNVTIMESDDGNETLDCVVITSEHTAGTAELFALVMRDAAKTKIVGERTFGKNTEQKVYSLYDGSAVIVSNLIYSSSLSDFDISLNGIEPDISLEIDDIPYTPPGATVDDYSDELKEAIKALNS